LFDTHKRDAGLARRLGRQQVGCLRAPALQGAQRGVELQLRFGQPAGVGHQRGQHGRLQFAQGRVPAQPHGSAGRHGQRSPGRLR